ncbi:MAG: GAK system CofD-like protein [Gammaproteobacteria bacterium]|nr:GAK system CofD-like protein [Gammaproteobacteria bacterium]
MAVTTFVRREALLPDPVRIHRYQRIPELGPKILFFTGGTAINGVSRVLKRYTHNSIHLVTPFDSGGSSAKLRKAFAMPSIGDLRSRMMALADDSIEGNPEVVQLFAYRLPKKGKQKHLKQQLHLMQRGEDILINAIPNPMRRLIRTQLGYFLEAMPADFDLRGASIGNLILAGGYLNNHRHLDPIVYLFSKLVNVKGTVRTIVNEDLHIGAKLADGSTIIGQHNLTGKEVRPLQQRIDELFLTRGLDQKKRCKTMLRDKIIRLIESADLICYPMGSFYSSMMANLLPLGVADAIARSNCPKIFIPNVAGDPEQVGLGLNRSVERLLETLEQGRSSSGGSLLDYILLDCHRGRYPEPVVCSQLTASGIEVIDTHLITRKSAPYYHHKRVVEVLLSLT